MCYAFGERSLSKGNLYMLEDSLGLFITRKRQERGLSLRKFAGDLGKAPSYICDIEKGKKCPVDKDFLETVAKILNLNPLEKDTLFDLSSKGRKDIAPTDLAEYLKKTPLASVALRSARESKISNEKWKEIISLIKSGSK